MDVRLVVLAPGSKVVEDTFWDMVVVELRGIADMVAAGTKTKEQNHTVNKNMLNHSRKRHFSKLNYYKSTTIITSQHHTVQLIIKGRNHAHLLKATSTQHVCT